MIIAISGPHGSGKSTIAKALAKKLGLRYVSAGEIFRRLAREKGMSIVEFTKYTEEHPEIDLEIDKIILEEAKEGNVVLDSQLAYWFTKDLNPLSILVYADLEDRAKRISQREGISYEEAMEEAQIRDESEKTRFKKLYNIDLWNISDFHVIVNTSKISKEKIIEIVEDICRRYFGVKDDGQVN